MADAKVKLLLDLEDNVSGGLKNTSASVAGFQKNVADMQPVFKNMAVIGTASFAAITGAAMYSVNAYADAERAQRQLEHAVIDVSKGTKEQAQAISDLTDTLQNKSGIDGDALKMGAAQLSTFGLQSASVVNLTKSLADLTVNQSGVNASSDQYISSANAIAKALKGQFGVLEKSGIRFTDAQQKMILYGTEAEKVAAINSGLAQNLRETTDTLGGVDAATARATRSLGEIAESIGKALEPALLNIANAVTPVIQTINEWVAANPELVSQIITIGAGIAAVVAAVGGLGMILGPVITGFSGLSAAMGLLLSPIGLVVLAVTAIGAALVYLYGTNENARASINAAWASIQAFISAAVPVIINWLIQFGTWLNDLWVNSETFRANLAVTWSTISTFIGAAVQIIGAWLVQVGAWLNDLWVNSETFRANLATAWTAISEFIGQAIQVIGTLLFQFGTWLYDLWVSNEDTRIKLTEIWNLFSTAISNYFNLIWGVITWFIGGLKKFVTENETVKTILLAAWEVFKTGFKIILDFMGAQINLFLDVIKTILTVGNQVITDTKKAFDEFKTWWANLWSSIQTAVSNAITSITGFIDDMIKKITSAISAIGDFLATAAKVGSFGMINIGGGGAKQGTNKAAGGNVNPNTSYLVGEHRPEMFTPSGYGRIQPAPTGGGLVVNVSGNSFYGPDDLADRVMESLVGSLKQNILIS